MTSVLLVDDHALIRRGMRDALSDAGVNVAGEASGWDELNALLGTVSFDVLLLDINLAGPSGLEILELLKTSPHHPPRTLVVSMYPEDPYALKALTAGAWGYVSKSSPTSTLVEAIQSVVRGRKHITPALAALMIEQQQSAPKRGLPHESLSPRELLLLTLLAEGRKLPDVAERLALPPKAVGVYRARLLEKMKISSNGELANYAARHGLVTAPA